MRVYKAGGGAAIKWPRPARLDRPGLQLVAGTGIGWCPYTQVHKILETLSNSNFSCTLKNFSRALPRFELSSVVREKTSTLVLN